MVSMNARSAGVTSATRIVEMKTGEGRAPVIEHGFERTVGEMRRHLRLEGEADHFAGQHREQGDAGVVFEQRARHRNLTLASPLFELPPIRFAPGPDVHDAPVREQVLRVPRSSVAGEVLWSTYDDQPLASAYLDRDHVAHDLLPEANARVEALGDDVHETFIRHQLEHHVGVGGQEAPQSRRDDDVGGRLRRADANASCGLTVRPVGGGLGHGRIELAERRRETREQLLTCRRGGEPPGRAMKERNSELLFEAANRLAERRGGKAEMGRRTYEAPALDDGRKRAERLEGAPPHYVARLLSP